MRVSWIIIAGALFTSTPGHSQDYYAVGTTFGTTHRVYRVTASGEVTIHQDLETGHLSEDMAIDPGGRFVWIVNGSIGGPGLIYQISDDHTLSLGGQVLAASPEWEVFRPAVITPDTSELIVLALAPGTSDLRVSLEISALNNSLMTSSVDAVWDVTDIPDAQLLVGAVSVYDSYTIFSALRILRYDSSLEMFSLTPQTTDYFIGRPAITPDGRFIVTSTTAGGGPEFGVNRVIGDGQSTLTLVDSIQDIDGFYDRREILVHPNGRFAFLMGNDLVSIEINPDTGEIVGVVEIEPAPSSNDMAITHDGQILLQATNRFGGTAIMIPYRINSDGTLDRLSHGLDLPFSTDDLAFIPPRPAPIVLGDANVDGAVDAADVVTVVEMSQPTARLAPPLNFFNADLDGDIDVDEDDLEELIGVLLGL